MPSRPSARPPRDQAHRVTGEQAARLDLLAELLAGARHALVLTGAGVSTESGLSDYRGTSGLWQNRRFEELAHIDTWRREPAAFWRFYAERLAALEAAQPNPGHLALAELERRGIVRRVLTQNVDGLHRAAGSRDPLELHGTLAEVECLACGFREAIAIAGDQLAAGATVPICPVCSAPLKPAVVLFGELLPPAFLLAQRELDDCDVLLCCGSSLQVHPVSGFPLRVLRSGGEIAIVNLGPTAVDEAARIRVEMSTGKALPALLDRLPA